MSDQEIVVTDMDLDSLPSELNMNCVESLVKQEPLGEQDMNMYPQNGMNFSHYLGNFETLENEINTLSIPDNQAMPIPFSTEELNQILSTNSIVDDTFNRISIDFKDLYSMEGIKLEPPTGTHFAKYKMDENGKHVKIWVCGICNKEFGHQYILLRHLPTHTDERKFVCKQCGKAFRQMSTLSQHRAIHSKLRPYVCEICKKTFNRVSTLISHRKTHTEDKPHRCHLCNKAFHQKGNLRNHIFTHTNARPYKCDICEKGFNQMSNLMCHKFKAHQKTDKPKYICPICSKEFDKRINLRNHEQYEHGDQNGNTSAVGIPPCNNGVLVSPINTTAMLHAIKTNQVPFALLRPVDGIPALVRVLPAGAKQMLVPARAEDLRKHGEISIRTEGEDGTVTNAFDELVDKHRKGKIVQIRIPVVASVIQRRNADGTLHMDVESPRPINECEGRFYITNMDNPAGINLNQTCSENNITMNSETGKEIINLLTNEILSEVSDGITVNGCNNIEHEQATASFNLDFTNNEITELFSNNFEIPNLSNEKPENFGIGINILQPYN